MDAKMEDFMNNIHELDHSERMQLISALDSIDDQGKVTDLIELLQDDKRHCPHCKATKIHKHGKSANLQRYECQNCGKTFNALSGTPLARLRKKELWLKYMDCMLESMTLRKIAIKLGISLKTAFLWRHRFIKEFKKDTPELLSGIVEADETYFQISRKGTKQLTRKPHKRGRESKKRGLSKEKVCVLTVTDRSHNGIEVVTGLGSVSGPGLHRHLHNKIASDAVMVTDGHRSYNYFCKKNDISHKVVMNENGKRSLGSYHIQNINSYHSRLKLWITGRFHGVATKYLNHYLWWRHELDSKDITDSLGLMKLAIGIPQLKGT